MPNTLFQGEHPLGVTNPENQRTPEIVKETIMKTYTAGKFVLGKALTKNRALARESVIANGKEGGEIQPRGVVVVSLWEEDGSLLTTKMFKRSVTELISQAEKDHMNLDIFVIANNGGGATPELGQKMRREIILALSGNSNIESVTPITTLRPEGDIDATVPWEVPLDLSTHHITGDLDRVFIINQEYNDLNRGKLRGLRDVSSFLAGQILDNGYAPDFIFQMDAETILEYKDPKFDGGISPLKAMYNRLVRQGKTAVGTKDRFSVMDPETGKPLDVPYGSAQRGYELTNAPDRFITLPGGALTATPESYLAAMIAISRETPSLGVEDYMYTKILRTSAKEEKVPFEDVSDSLGIITHLNRTPSNWRQSIDQMAKWRSHARAVDKIFPDEPYNTEPFLRYAAAVVHSRIKDAFKKGPKHLFRLLADIREIPGVVDFLNDGTSADIFDTKRPIKWTARKSS